MKKILPWLAVVCAGSLLLYLLYGGTTQQEPTLPTLTVQSMRCESEEFSLDVSISELGDARYPAMSMSISFDANSLEFLGIEEGNVSVSDASGKKLPDWSCNVRSANETGIINLMYLDISGGKNAFVKTLLNDGENVLVRLKFRLREKAQAVCELIVEDAVFAASNEAESLAVTTNTLHVRNGRLVIGD